MFVLRNRLLEIGKSPTIMPKSDDLAVSMASPVLLPTSVSAVDLTDMSGAQQVRSRGLSSHAQLRPPKMEWTRHELAQPRTLP